MRRSGINMIRKGVTAVVLAGLLISLGLWGVSYTPVTWTNGRTIISLSGGAIRRAEFSALDAGPAVWSWSGFQGFETAFLPSGSRTGGGLAGFVMPLWMPAILFGIGFWMCIRPFLRRRRMRILGRCLNCGYDLTALKSGICPECGTPVAPEDPPAE